MLSKFRNTAWLILPLLLVLALFLQSGGHLRLNRFSLQTVKAEEKVSVPQFKSTELNCQARWMQEVKAKDLQSQIAILPCSHVYMEMLWYLEPANSNLATEARALYPDLAEPLYWLAESNGGYTEPLNLPIYQQIVSEHSQEGLAWCYIGFLSEQSGDLEIALDARINCCYNGDHGYNGCYRAGRLYEQMGDQENAIKYYLLSKWEPAREKGRALRDGG